jgi:hypothetical protein
MMVDLQAHLLADLHQFAVPRHARWDPLGLMAVGQAIRERLAPLGPVEEHRFCSGGEEGVNLILRLPGREAHLPPLLVGAHYDGPLHSPGADDNASSPAGVARGLRSGGVGDGGQRCPGAGAPRGPAAPEADGES